MRDEPRFHVERVLHALGSKGRYQILMFILGSLGVFPACYQLMDAVFIGVRVPHRCAAVQNASSTLNVQGYRNFSVKYEQCDIVASDNGTELFRQGCTAGMEYDLPISRSVRSQFDLVCSEEPLFNLAQTLVFAGQGLGALVGTPISDRYGRKLVCVGCNFAFIPVGMVIAFAPNYAVYAVFKFLAGALQQGLYISKTIYLVELLPTEDRRLSAVFGGLSWAVASMTLAFVSFWFKESSWRYLHMTFTFTSLLAFVQLWFLDESLLWLVANGKTKQSIACIKKAARINKKDFEEVLKAGTTDGENSMEISLLVQTPAIASNGEANTDKSGLDKNGCSSQLDATSGAEVSVGMLQAKTKKLTLLDLLKTRRLLINTIAMLFAWFTCALSYFTLYLTASSLSGDKYLNYFLMSVMEVPACIFFFFSFNRIGRKATTVILYAVLGTGLFAVGLFRHFSNVEGDVFDTLTLLASLVATVGASGTFFAIFYYLPELFPTNLRNQALGVASFTARIGAMLAPFTGVLTDIAIWAPGLVMGVFASLVAVVLLILPETKDKALPQSLAELKTWQKKSSGEADSKKRTKEEKGHSLEKNGTTSC